MKYQMTSEQRAACSRGQLKWWANCSPKQRYSRSRGLRKHARSAEHRQRMSRNIYSGGPLGCEQLRKHRITYGRLGREDKKTIKASVHPTIVDLHWAAGFLEGDGSFRPNSGSTDVQVAQVNVEPLMKLQRLFGGSVKKRQSRTSTSSSFFVWFISGPRSRGVMMTVYTLMSGRRQSQIDKALGWSR